MGLDLTLMGGAPFRLLLLKGLLLQGRDILRLGPIRSQTMSRTIRRSMRAAVVALVVAVIGGGAFALLRHGELSLCPGSTRDLSPSGAGMDGGGPNLAGQSRPPDSADQPGVPGAPEPSVSAKVEAYLREHLPRGWTVGKQSGVDPQSGQRLVGSSPGGLPELVSYCLSKTPAPPIELGTFACAVVSINLMPPSALSVSSRADLATRILGSFDAPDRIASYQLLSALEWLWRLDFDGQAFEKTRWAQALVDVAAPVMRTHDLRAHRALARLGALPSHVMDSLLTTLRQQSCADLQRQDAVLRDEHLLALALHSGRGAEDALLERLDACPDAPAANLIGLSLRIGRGDPWDAVHARLTKLAARQDLPDADYIACVRQAVAYAPALGIRALPGLLRLRPDMRLTEAAILIDTSLDWVHSIRQAADLVESGRLLWDESSMRLRASS